MKGRPRLIVRIDSFALSELRQLAEGQGLTLSAFVREILYSYLEVYS